MQKFIVYFSIIILMLFSACAQQQIQQENKTRQIQDKPSEANVPMQVVKNNNANFSAVVHPMQLENPLWKGKNDASGVYHTTIRYKLASEKGMDEYRLNITLRAVNEAISELENLSGIKFEKINSDDYDILIEINASLKHVDPKALGISKIISYMPVENYNVITEAWIALTPTYPCAAKIEAEHELLHILGFGHANETNSILYAYGAVCTSKITDPIKISLEALYPKE